MNDNQFVNFVKIFPSKKPLYGIAILFAFSKLAG